MPLEQTWRRYLVASLLVALLVSSCTASDSSDEEDDGEPASLIGPPRQYSAQWIINAEAVGMDEVASPYVYREVFDDRSGRYLVETPDHLALQHPEEVVLCAAIARLPLDPYCAATPRAEGSPHVLSYPIQMLREWSPRGLYDLASWREVSLTAAADTDNWVRRQLTASNDIAVECFVVTGTTPAAETGFEICFTDDDLHLVASVDLQSDLNFEVELLFYDRFAIGSDFDTGLEEFFEARPSLHEQLLDLYPEIPAPRPTPTPEPEPEPEPDS